MTAVMSHMAKAEGVNLKLALMVVPSTDLRWSIGEEPLKSEVAKKYPSVAMVEHNPWGPKSRMDWFMDHWIPKGTGEQRGREHGMVKTLADDGEQNFEKLR